MNNNNQLLLEFERMVALQRAPYEAELAARAGLLESTSTNVQSSSTRGFMPWPINYVFTKFSRRGGSVGEQIRRRRVPICFDVLLDVFAFLDSPTLFRLAPISRHILSAFLGVIPREPSICVFPFVRLEDGRILVKKPENATLRENQEWNGSSEAVFPIGFARPPNDIELIKEVIFRVKSSTENTIFPSLASSPKFPITKETKTFCSWLAEHSGEYFLDLLVGDKFDDPSRPFHCFRKLFPLLRGPFRCVRIVVFCGSSPKTLVKNLAAVEKFLSVENSPPEFVRSSPNLTVQIVVRDAGLFLAAAPERYELLVDWLFKALPSNTSTTGTRRRLLKMNPLEFRSSLDQQIQQPFSAQTLGALYQRIVERMRGVTQTADSTATEFVLSVEGVERGKHSPNFPEFERVLGRSGREELLIICNGVGLQISGRRTVYFWRRPISAKYAADDVPLESFPSVSGADANADEVGEIKRRLADICFFDAHKANPQNQGERILYLRHHT